MPASPTGDRVLGFPLDPRFHHPCPRAEDRCRAGEDLRSSAVRPGRRAVQRSRWTADSAGVGGRSNSQQNGAVFVRPSCCNDSATRPAGGVGRLYGSFLLKHLPTKLVYERLVAGIPVTRGSFRAFAARRIAALIGDSGAWGGLVGFNGCSMRLAYSGRNEPKLLPHLRTCCINSLGGGLVTAGV